MRPQRVPKPARRADEHLAQFRGMLVEELSQHPIAFAMDDDEEDEDDDAAAAAR